jgi:hypothetical protein
MHVIAWTHPTLQEQLLESCKNFGGKFFHILPTVWGCPPCNYHVFKPMKKAHEDHCFDMDAGVQEPITLWFHGQPQDFYKRGIDRRMKLWDACLNHGTYGD